MSVLSVLYTIAKASKLSRNLSRPYLEPTCTMDPSLFDYLFANLEMVVPVVDKGGEMVAETKAVQPEVEDGRVHHLKTMKQ